MAIVQPFGFFAPTGISGIGYGNPTYDTGVIAYFDFGDNTDGSFRGSSGTIANGSTAYDLSGNGYDSTLNNTSGQSVEYIDSQSLGVVRAAGTKAGGRWEMADFAGSQLGLTAFTFEFVINTNNIFDDNVILRFAGSGTNSRAEWNLQQYGGSPVPNRISYDQITEQNTSIPSTTTNVTINNGWHHIVATAAVGDTTRTYYDGAALGNGSTTWPVSDDVDFDETNAWMGNTNYGAGVFLGDIAVFRVYDNAMSAANVTANYNYYDSVIGF